MGKIAILCIEDEREVLDALVRDLEPFAAAFQIEAAQDVEEARPLVEQLLERGAALGLVLADHLLPGASGVEFLIELSRDPRTASARKVLVTAQAGLDDTVKAVNQAGLDHYIAKPWTLEQLHQVVRDQLTAYVIACAADVLPYVKVLDGKRILAHFHQRRAD